MNERSVRFAIGVIVVTLALAALQGYAQRANAPTARATYPSTAAL
jgi:hypothetical protein